jgi:hypothetical protein
LSFTPARLLSLQNGELMAQDQDFRGLPRLRAPRQPQQRGDPRDQRNTNRRHIIGDHHG